MHSNKTKSNRYSYDKERFTALEAITEAQKIAFAPILFQAAINLRDTGILSALEQAGKKGLSCDEIQMHCTISKYSIQVLLDAGLSSYIVYQQNDLFFLAKIGHFLLNDKMTRINMNFTQDVCYKGMFQLKEALETGKPQGLSVFGDWETIYPALSQLPEKAKKSWFEYDHFYSDHAFEAAFKHISILKPQHIYDIGGNTGKWALYCAKNSPNINITIIDLPEQLAVAEKNIHAAGLEERINLYPADLLKSTNLPNVADIWWMSQFLDCFSEAEIITILTLIYNQISPNSRVCILEIFWDRQQFEAGALSINASSLYFTCMANGNSRFYHSRVLYDCLRQVGFHVEQDIDGLGIGHTLLICKKI